MIIAVATHEPSPVGLVAARFGQAPWFLVYDTQVGKVEHLAHPQSAHADADAGLAAARLLRGHRVGAVVAGAFGDNAQRVLLDARLCLFSAGNVTVAQAITDFCEGRLRDV